MTTDLWCVVANALWGVTLTMFESTAKTRIAGTRWNMGNREKSPEWPGWVERIGRALSNHKENFLLFLTAVVVVHLAGKADGTSAMASIGYVAFRVLHAAIYIAGITKVRSLIFSCGMVCTLIVLSRLV